MILFEFKNVLQELKHVQNTVGYLEIVEKVLMGFPTL